MTIAGANGNSAVSAARATPLEKADIAYGIVLGADTNARSIRPRRPPLEPIDALEQAIGRALRRPPCLISFSGGRDSSALLAVATRLARREKLELPIPATLRFPGSKPAEEDEWQSSVISHLHLSEWLRIAIVDDQLDAVGSAATKALEHFGLIWPFNSHFHLPIIERAAGGSVITGFGGDEIALSSATSRAERVVTGAQRPRRKDLLVVGLAAAPRPIRSRVQRNRAHRTTKDLAWLTESGRRALAREIGMSDARVPFGWSRVLRSCIPRGRYFTICEHTFSLLGSLANVEVVHPFVDSLVLDALAAKGGFAGLGDRDAVTRALFGDVLPEATIGRQTKASFTDPLWTDTARRFAVSWSGQGLDTDWIDVDALRDHWIYGPVDVRSTTLLQAAWLHDQQIMKSRGR